MADSDVCFANRRSGEGRNPEFVDERSTGLHTLVSPEAATQAASGNGVHFTPQNEEPLNRHTANGQYPVGEGEALTPDSSPLTPQREALPLTRDFPPPTPQNPEAEARRRQVLFDINNDPWYTILDSEIYDLMCECEHPDFDPHLAAFDEDYFQSFTDCTDPECVVHGENPEIHFNPNDFHY